MIPCVLAGSAFVANQADIDDLAGYCELTGDLEIDAAGLTDAVFPDLEVIGGRLLVHDNVGMTLSMPALLSVAGDLEVHHDTGPTRLDFPLLTTLADVHIVDNAGVVSFLAPSLVSAGEFVLRDSGAATLDVPALATLGSLVVESDANLTAWPFVGLVSAGALDLRQTAVGVSWDLSFPALIEVSDVVSITGDFGCAETTFDAPSWILGGDVWLDQPCPLSFLAPSLDLLTGSVAIESGYEIVDLDLSALREAVAIAGDVGFDLPSLELLHGQLAAFGGISAPRLVSIEGEVVELGLFDWQLQSDALYANNHCVSGASVDLPALVSVDGAIHIEDSNSLSPCVEAVPFTVNLGALVDTEDLYVVLAELDSTLDLSSLQHAGTLTVGVARPDLAALVSVDEELSIWTSGLEGTLELPLLEVVGAMAVSSEHLTSIAMPALERATGADSNSVVGVTVVENPDLVALEIPTLREVVGPVVISDNPLLCRPIAEAIADRVAITDGFVDVSGNNEDPACYGDVEPEPDTGSPPDPVDTAGEPSVLPTVGGTKAACGGCNTGRPALSGVWVAVLVWATERRRRRPRLRRGERAGWGRATVQRRGGL